jgi:hypothetical protein
MKRRLGHETEAVMKRLAASLFVLMCMTPSLAADFPARKPGLWQLNMMSATGHTSFQECVDAHTDQAMQSQIGGKRPGVCSNSSLQKSGDTITREFTCTGGGYTTFIRMVATGNFDSNYTVTMTSRVQGQPAPPPITATAKWLGPCAAGQRPGDIIMANGKTMNILDLQKAMPGTRTVPAAPHQ